ncbi:MAG: hypothetical protein MUO50_20520, partial [Longimicrobiales bacterium]|nr:hypothetical protein [Longimicrobiales bacterium]
MSEPLVLATPTGRAPDLMWLATGWPRSGDDMKKTQEESFRQVVAAMVRSFHGFGVGEAGAGSDRPPEKRHIAYGDLLFPFKKDEPSFKSYSSQEKPCSSNLSSCGVTVRALWLLIGARHPLLNPPYQNYWVMTWLRAFSIVSGAFVGNSAGAHTAKSVLKRLTDPEEIERTKKEPPKLTRENFKPKAGDTLFINREKSVDKKTGKVTLASQHVSTIVELLPEESTADCTTYI